LERGLDEYWRRNGASPYQGLLKAVLDKLRILLASFTVRHLHYPRPLVIHARLWLAGETDNLEQRRRYLEAVLESNPEGQATRADWGKRKSVHRSLSYMCVLGLY
jgi:hypothetical protein